jgi:hypothetical protein
LSGATTGYAWQDSLGTNLFDVPDVGPANIVNGFAAGDDCVVTGTLSATDLIATSDARLKEDIAPIQHALDKVRVLIAASWKWREKGTAGAGVIAQEVHKVFPIGVSVADDADGTLSVHPMALIGLLVAAVQELEERVERLEKRGR